jgi:uncharacterized protein (DUF2141 family)
MSFVLTCIIFTPESYSQESNLKINILNLEKPGVVFTSICKNAAGFEESVKNESEEESCINGAVGVDFENYVINGIVPHGEYAIAVFVDVNGNGKMDKNFLGIPKEQYGFSNNVMGKMAAPSFEMAKFSVTGPTTQNIKLRIGIPKQN